MLESSSCQPSSFIVHSLLEFCGLIYWLLKIIYSTITPYFYCLGQKEGNGIWIMSIYLFNRWEHFIFHNISFLKVNKHQVLGHISNPIYLQNIYLGLAWILFVYLFSNLILFGWLIWPLEVDSIIFPYVKSCGLRNVQLSSQITLGCPGSLINNIFLIPIPWSLR